MVSTFLGLFVAVAVSEVFEAQTFSNFLRFPVMFLCGLFFPVEMLPLFLRPLSYILPLSYGVDMRHGAVGGVNLMPLSIDTAVLGLFCAGLFAASLWNIRQKWILYKVRISRRACAANEMRQNRLLQFAVLFLFAAIAVGSAWVLLLRPVKVQVAKTEQNVPVQVFGLGTVEAQIVSGIGFETAGTLVELHADHGDSAKKGALLARLDSREQEARLSQARAAVSQAEATLEQASATVARAEAVLKEKMLTNERRQELVRRGTTSQQSADEAQAAADVAKADLAQAGSAVGVARANLQQAKAVLDLEEARLAKYSLYAPYDGLVIKRHRELGSALSANEKAFTLVDPETIWALAYIDEARAGAIKVGQPAQVVRRSAPSERIQAEWCESTSKATGSTKSTGSMPAAAAARAPSI